MNTYIESMGAIGRQLLLAGLDFLEAKELLQATDLLKKHSVPYV